MALLLLLLRELVVPWGVGVAGWQGLIMAACVHAHGALSGRVARAAVDAFICVVQDDLWRHARQLQVVTLAWVAWLVRAGHSLAHEVQCLWCGLYEVRPR